MRYGFAIGTALAIIAAGVILVTDSDAATKKLPYCPKIVYAHPPDDACNSFLRMILIGRCEQPGSGSRNYPWGVQWNAHRYGLEGGLGFTPRTWDRYKLGGYPGSAAKATWRQQMKVALRIGFSRWQRVGGEGLSRCAETFADKWVVVTASMPKNWKTWIRIGRCEQPGSGAWGIRWNHPGPRYQGGLGFFSGTWDSFKPRGYPADAGQATWRQQMNVANRVARAVGFSAWGCN
jgi:hypothetical protein